MAGCADAKLETPESTCVSDSFGAANCAISDTMIWDGTEGTFLTDDSNLIGAVNDVHGFKDVACDGTNTIGHEIAFSGDFHLSFWL